MDIHLIKLRHAWYITYEPCPIGEYHCYTTCWCSEVSGNIPLGPAALAVYSQKPPPQQVVYLVISMSHLKKRVHVSMASCGYLSTDLYYKTLVTAAGFVVLRNDNLQAKYGVLEECQVVAE